MVAFDIHVMFWRLARNALRIAGWFEVSLREGCVWFGRVEVTDMVQAPCRQYPAASQLSAPITFSLPPTMPPGNAGHNSKNGSTPPFGAVNNHVEDALSPELQE